VSSSDGLKFTHYPLTRACCKVKTCLIDEIGLAYHDEVLVNLLRHMIDR